jgi:hypothetical protein
MHIELFGRILYGKTNDTYFGITDKVYNLEDFNKTKGTILISDFVYGRGGYTIILI